MEFLYSLNRLNIATAQNVIERRYIGALWVAALHRLIELLRIANQQMDIELVQNIAPLVSKVLIGYGVVR
jgi:hypothetical protein